MAYVPTVGLIPNEATASGTTGGNVEQADIDSIDFLLLQLALAGYGVISGCQVTAQTSPDMTVQVSAGLISVGAQQVHVPAGSSVAFAASSTNPKYGLVEIHGTLGTIIRNGGTAAAAPIFPNPTVGNVVVAALWIPTNATSITAGQIIDKRVPINSSFSTSGKLFLNSFDSTRSRP